MKQEKFGNQDKSQQKYQPGNRRPELDEDSLPGQRQRPIEAEGREGNYEEDQAQGQEGREGDVKYAGGNRQEQGQNQGQQSGRQNQGQNQGGRTDRGKGRKH